MASDQRLCPRCNQAVSKDEWVHGTVEVRGYTGVSSDAAHWGLF